VLRWLLSCVVVLAACNDLRDFRGTWQGTRVGDQPVLRVGPGERMTLAIDEIDSAGISGTLAIEGLATAVPFRSVAGAEADAIATLTFAGSPLRVYLAIVTLPASTAPSDAFVLIALYDDQRIEARVIRGGQTPVYAIFALEEAT
jgi:hypothetical protein